MPRWGLHAALIAIAAFTYDSAFAAGDPARFVVADIRIEGLQRIAAGTVFNYLPVSIGDTLDESRVAEALRALYDTGFFRDVELRRDGDILIVAVRERPSIESFSIRGNKEIKTEDLQKSLRAVGLATGKSFDASVLDEVRHSLIEQYLSRGKYAVEIDATVEELPGNKVKVDIDLHEGKPARIRQINIAGNVAFTDETLREQFKLHTPNWLSWYSRDDRYARETLTGDLEQLRAHYMDRGYANFAITSTQVAVAPEKDDLFLTINVSEGEVFRVGDVRIAGNRVVAAAELTRLLDVHAGDMYSRKRITATTEALKARLALEGYAFATVDAVPQADTTSGSVSLSFVIDPHSRVYVRRVSFNGAAGINDAVLRRELRQLEGTYLSNAAVDRSRQRIQRLPFVESVESSTTPVPGAPDLVDVEYDIKEGLPGQFGLGVGYSPTNSFSLNGNFVHSNFLGTGTRVAADLNLGRYQNIVSLSHTDPYTTIDGVQRTIAITYKDAKQFTSATSAFDTRSFGGSVSYDIPLSEYQWLTLGVAMQRTDQALSDNGTASLEAIDWVSHNGEATLPCRLSIGLGPCTPSPLFDTYRTTFDTHEVSLGWLYDSRDRVIFARSGARQELTLSYTLPVSDVQFWTASYEYLQFVPLNRLFTLMFRLDAAYGAAFGSTTAFPPYRQFYAGGIESVRGFEGASLGPRDSLGRPYGGNLQTILQTELLLPMPEKWRNSARCSLFYDIGGVFSDQNIDFLGPDPGDRTPRSRPDYRFRFGELRQSTGIALQWLSPLGTFRMSYGIPLNARDRSSSRYGDDDKQFDFSIGRAF